METRIEVQSLERSKLWGSGLTFDIIKKVLNRTVDENDELLTTLIKELEILKLRLDYKKYQKY